MLKKIAIVVLLLIAVPLVVILALAATQPDTFRVQRATAIKAPPETIFPSSTTSTLGRPGRPTRRRIPA